MKTPLLRILIFTFSFSLFTFHAHSQWVSIPDTIFGSWLNTHGYAACMQGNNTIGWQMDTTCPTVVNATFLDCSNFFTIKSISGIEYFDNLQQLYCDRNQITYIAALPRKLRIFACGFNDITSLPALPDSLRELNCYNNELTSLPALPAKLTKLLCYSNDALNTLPVLPALLRDLRANHCNLSVSPALPDSLRIVYLNNNNLTSIPALPPYLTHLDISSNQLTTVPALPSTLQNFLCMDNSIASLPPLPNGLGSLGISFNPITTFPVLPASLYILYADSIHLTAFPATFPPGLTYLYCSRNNLTSLPALPMGLRQLACTRNQLTSLPVLPESLLLLNCEYNSLTSIPELPDSMETFYCYNNPGLSCLPELKKITWLRFDNTGVTCVPNYGTVVNSTPRLDTVPLCDANNVNGCATYWNISGRTYNDVNANCQKDAADTALYNMKINLSSGGNPVEQTYSGGAGYFSFNTPASGIYDVSVDTANIPLYVTCPINNLFIDTISLVDSFKYNNNFALECKPGFDLAAWSVHGLVFRADNQTLVNIQAGDLANFFRVYCAGGVSGAVTISFSGPITYVAPAMGARTPVVSSNTLTYNIADFGTVNFDGDFHFTVLTAFTAQIGDQVCFTISVSPITGDNNPANNTYSHCFTVVGSFDPNDKQVSPIADIDTSQKWLTYTVRFQNTGTAEAQHIYITDTLYGNIDVSSFQLLAYSHQPMVQIKGNAVRFNYPNINLPDSNTNEPESHGYVQYKVKLKDNLPIGTQINNTAFIYFDFNEPVITNTTTNTISVISGMPKAEIATLSFEMFPNPANDVVSVIVDEQLIGAVLTVSDITGRVMQTLNIAHRMSNIEVKDFSAGIYFVTISTPSGVTATKKLVVGK